MMTFCRVTVFSACCVHCDEQVTYTVTEEHLPTFAEIDESGDHRPFCNHCDFYSQEDLLAAFRVDAYVVGGDQ